MVRLVVSTSECWDGQRRLAGHLNVLGQLDRYTFEWLLLEDVVMQYTSRACNTPKGQANIGQLDSGNEYILFV